jgi:hypothetical protein
MFGDARVSRFRFEKQRAASRVAPSGEPSADYLIQRLGTDEAKIEHESRQTLRK